MVGVGLWGVYRVGPGDQSSLPVSANDLWMNSPLIPKRWTPGFPLKRSRKAPSMPTNIWANVKARANVMNKFGWQGRPRSQDRLPTGSVAT